MITDSRGQTANDFILGISVFLVSVIILFSLLTGLYTPFNAPIKSDQTVVASRVSDQVLQDLTPSNKSNTLSETYTADFFTTNDADDIREQYRLKQTVHINVSLVAVNESMSESVGESIGNHPVASSTRIVIDNGARCQPSCRLRVRVW